MHPARVVINVVGSLFIGLALAGSAAGKPLTNENVIYLLKAGLAERDVLDQISKRGLASSVDEQTLDELSKGQASPVFLSELARLFAVQSFEQGDSDSAEALLHTSISMAPNADSLFMLGKLDYLSGRHQAAVRWYSEVLKITPAVSALRERARVYLLLGEFEKADHDLNGVLSVRPDAVDSLLVESELLIKLGKVSKSIASAKRACELTKYLNYQALEQLASSYAASDQFEEAEKWQERALHQAPPAARAEVRDRAESYKKKQANRSISSHLIERARVLRE